MSRDAHHDLALQDFLHAQQALPAAVPVITAADIRRLERALSASGTRVDLVVQHHFAPGVYARELFIPAGTTLTGRTHRFENLNILSQGEISVLVEGRIQRLSAPVTLISPPGTKRVAYSHSDCIWTTVHGTDLRDLEQIERTLLWPEPTAHLSHEQPEEIR